MFKNMLVAFLLTILALVVNGASIIAEKHFRTETCSDLTPLVYGYVAGICLGQGILVDNPDQFEAQLYDNEDCLGFPTGTETREYGICFSNAINDVVSARFHRYGSFSSLQDSLDGTYAVVESYQSDNCNADAIFSAHYYPINGACFNGVTASYDVVENTVTLETWLNGGVCSTADDNSRKNVLQVDVCQPAKGGEEGTYRVHIRDFDYNPVGDFFDDSADWFKDNLYWIIPVAAAVGGLIVFGFLWACGCLPRVLSACKKCCKKSETSNRKDDTSHSSEAEVDQGFEVPIENTKMAMSTATSAMPNSTLAIKSSETTQSVQDDGSTKVTTKSVYMDGSMKIEESIMLPHENFP